MLGLIFPTLVTANNAKEQERVTESGNVMKDLVDASNGIPTNQVSKPPLRNLARSAQNGAGHVEIYLTGHLFLF
jgi:hypothetical protein